VYFHAARVWYFKASVFRIQARVFAGKFAKGEAVEFNEFEFGVIFLSQRAGAGREQ